MLDESFTYGGLILGLAALALWIRFALRALPSVETMIARYQDEPVAADARAHRGLARLAACATAVALTVSVIGYAIPD